MISPSLTSTQHAHNILFNVRATSSQRYGCCIDVETTFCAYWVTVTQSVSFYSEHTVCFNLFCTPQDDVPLRKLFIGRLPDDTKQEDLDSYFGQFGELTDVYIPTPYRGFGFVTFASSDVARSVLSKSQHSMKVCSLFTQVMKILRK